MKISIEKRDLKFVLHAAQKTPKADAYRYLVGVLIQGHHIVATDGHRMAVARNNEKWTGDDIIIPREVIVAALKEGGGKQKTITLSFDTERETYILGGIAFASVWDTYPDWQSVIPDAVTGENSLFYPKYLSEAAKALYDYRKLKIHQTHQAGIGIALHKNGHGPAIVCYEGGGFPFCIVMPLRERNDEIPTWKNPVKETCQ